MPRTLAFSAASRFAPTSPLPFVLCSPDGANVELQMAAAADVAARRHLHARRPVLIDDAQQGEGHYHAFHEIAATVYGDQLTKAEAMLDRLDAVEREGLDDPSDAACDRWAPELKAAFYFGLALGARLAKGGTR